MDPLEAYREMQGHSHVWTPLAVTYDHCESCGATRLKPGDDDAD